MNILKNNKDKKLQESTSDLKKNISNLKNNNTKKSDLKENNVALEKNSLQKKINSKNKINNISKRQVLPDALLNIFNKYISNYKKKMLKKYKNSIKLKVHVLSTFNNILVSVINEDNCTLLFSSAGSLKFKNTQKSSPYAAEILAKLVSSIILYTFDASKIKIYFILTGPGFLKKIFVEWALKYLNPIFIKEKIKYVFNGTRPKNPRKV